MRYVDGVGVVKKFRILRTKFVSLTAAVILAANGLGVAAAPLFLSETVFALSNAANVYMAPGASGDCSKTSPCGDFSDALAAVKTGGEIHLADGTYQQTVSIGKDVTVMGDHTAQTIIQAPTILASGSIVNIGSGAQATLSHLTVTGPGAGSCGAINYGIYVNGGANADIHNVDVTSVRDNPLSGCQNGRAIYIDNATATINKVVISDYQKEGIYVTGPSSSATITNDTLTGVGATNLIAQNGIAVLDGAVASIDNNTVSDNECNDTAGNCGADPVNNTQSAGVLLYGAAGGTSVTNNHISNNDIGIYNQSQGTSNISDNTLSNNRYEGMVFDQGNANASGNTISGDTIGIYVVSYTGNTGNSSVNLTGDKVNGATMAFEKYDQDTADSYVPEVNLPADVYVKSSWTASSNTGHVYGFDAFPDVQSAVNAVAPGGTVHVMAGKYDETVNVSKAVTLDGAQAGVDARNRSGSESTLNSVNGSPNIQINSSDVTVDGFTLNGPANSSEAISMTNAGSGYHIQNNIFNDYSRAVNFNDSNTTFTQNKVNAIGADYIDGFEENSNAANNVTFDSNDFYNGYNGKDNNADISFIGDPNQLSAGLTVENNRSFNGATLLNISNTSNAMVENNVATDSQSAIFVAGGNQNLTIQGNSITNDTNGTAVAITNYFGYGPSSFAPSYHNSFVNDGTGVKVDTTNPSLSGTADFRNNWWGDASGPKDTDSTDGSLPASNPSGTGSPAVGAVEYGPWCTVADCSSNAPTVPANGMPNGGFEKTNDFYFNWDTSKGSGPITYEFQSSMNPANSNGVLTTGVWDNIKDGNSEQKNLITPQIHSTGAPDGTWYWQVRAIDTYGNKSAWSPIWSVTIDTKAPAVPSATFIADNTNTAVASGGFTNSQDFKFDLSNPAADGVDHYQLKYWNNISGSAFNGENNAWNPTNLNAAGHMAALGVYTDNFTQGEGTHYFEFSACDAAGNCSPYSDPYAVTYDTNILTVPILSSPSNGAVVKGASVTNSWNSVPDATNYEYESFNSSDTSQTPRYDHIFSTTSKTATNVADGTVFYWRVRAIDQYGQKGPWSDLWEVTVDNTAPVVAITAPGNGNLLSYAKDGTVTIKGSVTDANPDHYFWKITGPNGYDKNQTVSDKSSFTNQTITTWNLNGLASGTYTIDLEARDAAGNKGVNSVQTIQVTVDNTAPTITGSSISSSNSNPAWAKVGDTVTLNFTASEDINTPTVTIDGQAATVTGSGTNWSASYVMQPSDTEGTVPFTVDFSDLAENDSTAVTATTDGSNVTFDKTAPAAPTSSPTPGKYTSTQTVTLSDSDNTANIYYTTDGSDPTTSLTVNTYTNGNPIIITSTTTIKAVAIDPAGNVSPVATATYKIKHNSNASIVHNNALINNNAASGNGNNGGGGTGQVLGTNTQNNSGNNNNSNNQNQNGQVLGAHTNTLPTINTKLSSNKNFLVLGWWWLLVLAAMLGLTWVGFSKRSSENTSG